MVKQELNSEEKFFEKAVITEKFVKRYKKLLISSVVVVVLVVVANIVYVSSEESRVIAANEALASLKINPKDTGALKELKVLSPNLYDLWLFSQASVNNDLEAMKALKESKAPIINDLIKYELAQDVDSMQIYAEKQDSIYKDLALVKSAIVLFSNNEIDEAHNTLIKVSPNSSLSNIVNALLHYGVK
jgi:hypothetical protein